MLLLKGETCAILRAAHPAICHCSHLLLKCRVATIISHWLNVHSTHLGKSVFWSAFGFFNIAFIIPSHFIVVPYLTLWMLPSGCQTVWIQIRPNTMSALIWVQTIYKGYQQMTKVAASGQRVKYRTTCWYYLIWLKSISFGSDFFHLAKVLVTTSSEPG